MALNVTVKVHPVILFQIIDAYERRNADAHRVIGTLLGTVDKGTVEVSNCFCVPHKEYAEKVEADLKFASDMWDLNKRVSPQETIVGWWATGDEVTSHSALIHEYYTRECNNPVHLTVDTTLQSGKLGIKAYVCVPIGVPRGTTGSMFTPVPVETIQTQPEVVGVRLCQKSKQNANREAELTSELGQIADTATSMESMLDTVLAYMDEVLAGRISADNVVGRELLAMIHSVPKMSAEKFDEMINSNVKDLLMVIYLSQLTRTQLQLNEKLTLLSTN